MSDAPLEPGQWIGILGGGQLGRMLAVAASRLGLNVHIYEPGADCPASAVAARTTTAPYDDGAALDAFARSVAARYPTLPVYLQPGNHSPPPPDDDNAAVDMAGIMERMRWLVDRTVADQWFDATVLPQLHVLLWGNLRGV